VQRLCEWRSSFRSAADVMFELFFDNNVMFKDYGACQKWAGKILKDCDFVWAVPEKVGFSTMSGSLVLTSTLPQGNQSGLMRAPFILQVFAIHLNSIVGAQEVPEIEVAGDFEDASVVSRYPPIGALALATAAVNTFSLYINEADALTQVERTLRLWANGEIGPGIKAVAKLNPQTGVVSNATSHFSTENWGQATMYYVKSISKMKTVSLEEIVDLAAPFMSPLKSRQLSARALADNDNDNDNLRACLVEVEDWHVISRSLVFQHADHFLFFRCPTSSCVHASQFFLCNCSSVCARASGSVYHIYQIHCAFIDDVNYLCDLSESELMSLNRDSDSIDNLLLLLDSP
jgi:hypothetical protein